MALTYRLPSSYAHDSLNTDLLATSTDFNITGIVGLGRNWKQVSSIEMIKGASPVVPDAPANHIYLSNVTPFKGANEVVVGNKVELVPSLTLTKLLLSDYTENVSTIFKGILVVEGNSYYVKEIEGVYDLVASTTEGALKLVDKSEAANGTATLTQVMTSPHSEGIDAIVEAGLFAKGTLYFFTFADGKYDTAAKAGTGTFLLVEENSAEAYYVISDSANALTVDADPVPVVNQDSILLADGSKAKPGDLYEFDFAGSIPGFNNYVLGTDYEINADKTVITWKSTSTNVPATGSTYYITYKVNKKAEDYLPKQFFNSGAIELEYGPEMENGVINQLTLAADLLLEGQTTAGGGVVLCQVEKDTVAGWKAAINKMTNQSINTLICLKQDDIGVRSYLIEKIMYASADNYKHERTTFITPTSAGLTADTLAAQRKALMNDRVTFFANYEVTVAVTDSADDEEYKVPLSAIYACCNLSGIEGNPDYLFCEPQLRKELSSRITLTPAQEIDPTELTYLGSQYLSLITFNKFSNVCRIEDIFTTDSTNVLTETRAVRRETDLLRRTLRDGTEQRFIGKSGYAETGEAIVKYAKTVLDNFKLAKEINDYKDVTGYFNPNNVKNYLLYFKYKPVTEVKWIDVYVGSYI